MADIELLWQGIASINSTLIYEKVRQNNEDIGNERNVKELYQVIVRKYWCEILEMVQIHGDMETSSFVFSLVFKMTVAKKPKYCL
jgi:hypothetical protein